MLALFIFSLVGVRVSLCEVVHNETAGEMPTVGGLTAWIAVNAFGSLLAGRSAPLDNVMPSNLTRIDRDEETVRTIFFLL